VVLAGQAGVADHVHIGDRVVVGAQAGIFRDVSAGERMLGAPARPEREAKRILLSLGYLPGLCRDVSRAEAANDSHRRRAARRRSPGRPKRAA